MKKLPTPKQYPKHVIIGETEWDIKFCRKFEHKQTLGLCDPSTNTISIKVRQNKMQTLLTFVHEIIHAFEDEYNFDIGEDAVLKLERAIVDFILVNHPVFED